MKFYLAPLEGVTGYIYRNAYHTFYGGMDKYFSPFINANQSNSFKSRDLNDILPDNNKGMVLVPQLLTNKAQDFIQTAGRICELGYQEINLNLGCPSGTVVSKGRGAGFLAKPEELDRFFEDVFNGTKMKISVKTRIGKEQPEEFYRLIEIYNKYPIHELIIHPRLQTDLYKNKPNLIIFKEALDLSKIPVCYNGDLCCTEDFSKFSEEFPNVDTVMVGRGIISNPGLILEVKQNMKPDKNTLRAFHDKVFEDYQKVISGDRNVLFRMKEFWFYLIDMFMDAEKYAKKIKKSEHFQPYIEAVDSLFQEVKLIGE